jgi:hypothetical protein
MIAAAALAILFWAYCGGMSLLATSDRPLLQTALFQLSSVVLYCALASGVAWTFIQAGHPLMTVPAFVLVLIFGVLLGYRYLAFLIGETFDRFHSAATGIGNMKVRKTYDVAEKAEHDGDVELALGLYRDEAARDPGDPEPLRRMAELEVRRGAVGEGLELLRRALAQVSDAEPRSTLAFRLADLLEREGRGDEARAILESIERELAGTRFAAYARERLSPKG